MGWKTKKYIIGNVWVKPGLETMDRNNYISSVLSIPGLSRFQNILQTMLENVGVRQTV